MVLQPVPRDGAPAHAAWREVPHPAPRPTTTVPAADLAGRPDLTEKEASRLTPQFRKLVGDITYIHTREGCVYPAGRDETTLLEKNCWLRHGGTHANRIGPKRSAKLAVRDCQPIKGVTIFHSNRGSQYTSADYTATMNKYGFLASVGRTGVCYDNAAAESFNATCKKELVNRKIYHTRRKAIKEVTSWIELCYNQIRFHSSLGYRTPNEVHQEWRKPRRQPKPQSKFSLSSTKPIAVQVSGVGGVD